LRKGTADNKIDGYAESRRFSPSFGPYLGAATQIEEALAVISFAIERYAILRCSTGSRLALL
jgi:hypothetical protein